MKIVKQYRKKPTTRQIKRLKIPVGLDHDVMGYITAFHVLNKLIPCEYNILNEVKR